MDLWIKYGNMHRFPEILPSKSVKFARDVVPTIGAETPRDRDVISDYVVFSGWEIYHLLLTPKPGQPEPYLHPWRWRLSRLCLPRHRRWDEDADGSGENDWRVDDFLYSLVTVPIKHPMRQDDSVWSIQAAILTRTYRSFHGLCHSWTWTGVWEVPVREETRG